MAQKMGTHRFASGSVCFSTASSSFRNRDVNFHFLLTFVVGPVASPSACLTLLLSATMLHILMPFTSHPGNGREMCVYSTAVELQSCAMSSLSSTKSLFPSSMSPCLSTLSLVFASSAMLSSLTSFFDGGRVSVSVCDLPAQQRKCSSFSVCVGRYKYML